jgi:hypothetical protein
MQAIVSKPDNWQRSGSEKKIKKTLDIRYSVVVNYNSSRHGCAFEVRAVSEPGQHESFG